MSVDPRVIDLLVRRPRLVPVLLAIAEMIDGRRNCRVSVDVSAGSIRLFREVQERAVYLDPPSPPGIDVAGSEKTG